MTDAEKVDLIDKIIADYWENATIEKIDNGAEVALWAIASVVDFGRDGNG